MKSSSLLSDRNLILLLIHSGLTIAICGLFILIYDTGWIIVISSVAPLFIVELIPKYKKFKELVFNDEKYPEKNDVGKNLLLLFLFTAVNFVFLCLYYIMAEEIKWNLDREIYFFVTNTIYFTSVFLLFISKLAPHE